MSRPNKVTTNKISNTTKILQSGKTDQKKRIASKTATASPSTSSKNITNSKSTDTKKTKEDEKNVQIPTKVSSKKNLLAKQPSVNKVNQLTNSVSKMKTKPISTKIKTDTTSSRYEPLKAKRDVIMQNKLKNLIPSKPNLVKDTYHNVTVASPPPVRKKQNSVEFQSLPSEAQLKDDFDDIPTNIHERRRTVTLEPKEVIMLKKYDNEIKKNTETSFATNTDLMGEVIPVISIKEPIAFEINFDNEKSKLETSQIGLNETKKSGENLNNNDDEDISSNDSLENSYADDFESYESDFESGSSSAEATDTEESNVSENSNTHSRSDVGGKQNINNDEEEDSDETQPPITVIHREERETERKLDSGNYDLKSTNSGNKSLENKTIQYQQNVEEKNLEQQQLDSLETTTNNSDRLDSGIGSNSKGSIIFTEYSKEDFVGSIFPVSSESIRGKELMRKIQLDEISYHLFDLKPMDYEYFIKIYGNLKVSQLDTEGNDSFNNADEYQNSSHIDSRSVINNHVNAVNDNQDNNQGNDEIELSNNISKTIKLLEAFKKTDSKNTNRHSENQDIDLDKLNQFLNGVKMTVFEVLNRNSKTATALNTTKLSFSCGYRTLNANFLNALKVTKIFSAVKYNFILTIHESTEDIYKNEFQNLIVVWSNSDCENPIRLLSTWSQVSKVDICTESTDIIVSGLKDGSIAMWDLRESYSYCSKLDGYLTHFAASQSIVPIVPSDRGIQTRLKGDLGSVVDIKSFKPETGAYALKAYRQIQFVSLNDTGILTIWSLIEINQSNFAARSQSNEYNNLDIKHEFSSPWTRVKLVQSAICDLRSYLEIKILKKQTKFEQTLLYFENEIFDDQTLQELQKTSTEDQNKNKELQGLRFTTIDTSSNMIYVATNRNFILVCSKTLRPERFRKIYINESIFMFPTAIRLHPNDEFLIVGLSNGSVIAINCNQNKTNPIEQEFDNEDNGRKSNLDSIEMEKIQSSCAIQNMIRNERKMKFDELEQSNNYFIIDEEFRPRTAIPEFEELFENPWKQYKMFDQQILLNGTILRKNLIDCIEISIDGRKMYCLSDGNIKIYDFLDGNEIKCSKDEEIKGIGLIKSGSGPEHSIVLLKSNNIVEIHTPAK
ncbi:probable serine/threonine-protein kinase DDB_G0282963 [Condylostylus longicornis]|uniref:probable serine/threonine-protein kinase DDB_G0282963 n=1 Tax=Condylostylus longicornis TaxID=2530218 RepID=UPI00244E54B7|nr:probable serine/threonine-protein kinase DDB_G0282963 [Condylostylus longicornis]